MQILAYVNTILKFNKQRFAQPKTNYKLIIGRACLWYGWDSWVRTNEMTESKSVALPLGYIPVLN